VQGGVFAASLMLADLHRARLPKSRGSQAADHKLPQSENPAEKVSKQPANVDQ
jgi:hypothetical protein